MLETQRRIYDPDHPDITTTMSMLAESIALQGRFDEAEALFKDALDRRRRLGGPDHPSTLSTMSRMALSLYMEAGRYEDAQRVLGEAYEISRAKTGEKDPRTAAMAYNLGCLYALQNKRPAALDWLRKCLDAGCVDSETISQDPDLQNLRGDPEFERLVARAKAGTEKPAESGP